MSLLSDLVTVSVDEKPWIDFESSLNDDQVVAGYIPVKSTLDVFDFLKTATAPQSSEGRAVICWGSYGSGKSRLCAVLARLFSDGFDCPAIQPVWDRLRDRGESAKLDELRNIMMPGGMAWKKWLVVPMYASAGGGTLSASLIRSLLKALRLSGEDESLLGETVYHAAAGRLEQMIRSGARYESAPSSPYTTVEQLKRALEQDLDEEALGVFKEFHRKATHGVEFTEYVRTSGGVAMEANEVYNTVASKIQRLGYAGIIVIWDEFGFAIEALLKGNETGSRDLGKEAMDLQVFLERSCGSKDLDKRIIFLGFTHVTISEYGTRENLGEIDLNRLDTVSDRFRDPSINVRLSVTEREGYHLLAGMTNRTSRGKKLFENPVPKLQHIAEKMPKYVSWNRMSAKECYDEIVAPCYPLHPGTSISSILLSDQIAQANRTTFYFLQNTQEGGLAGYLENTEVPNANDLGSSELMRMHHLFTFFEQAIEESKRNLYDQYKEALVLHPKASDLEIAILQTTLILLVIANPDMSPSTEFLCFCLCDADSHDPEAKQVHDALKRLSDSQALWKNEATSIWNFVGGRGVSSELDKKLREEKDLVPKYQSAELIQKYPQVQNEITDVIGDFDLYPCDSGIVRRVGVRVLNLAKGDDAIEEVNPAREGHAVNWRSALIYLVVTDTSTQLSIWRQKVGMTRKPNVYFIFPSSPITINADKIRDLIATQNLLEKTPPENHAYDVLDGKLLKLRMQLRKQFETSFGNTGLRTGTTVIKSDRTSQTVTVSTWNELLPSIAIKLDKDFNEQIKIRCGSFNEWKTGSFGGAIGHIVERILGFDEHPEWQKQFLGFSETKQEAAIIDGVLIENRMLTQHALSQKWELMEVDNNCSVGILKEIHTHFTTGGIKGRDFSILFAKLVDYPYGIPNGIIPLLVALTLRKELPRITMYTKRGAILNKITRANVLDAIVKMAQKPNDYFTRYIKLAGKYRLVYKAIGPVMDIPFNDNFSHGQEFYDYCKKVRSALTRWISDLPEGVINSSDFTDCQKKLIKLLRGPVPPDLTTLSTSLIEVLEEKEDIHEEIKNPDNRNEFPLIADYWDSFRTKIDRCIEGIKAPLRTKIKALVGSDYSGNKGISNGLVEVLDKVNTFDTDNNPIQKAVEGLKQARPNSDPIDNVASAISDKPPENLTEEDYGRASGILEMAQLLKGKEGDLEILLPTGERRKLLDITDDEAKQKICDDVSVWFKEFSLTHDQLAALVIRVIYKL